MLLLSHSKRFLTSDLLDRVGTEAGQMLIMVDVSDKDKESKDDYRQ